MHFHVIVTVRFGEQIVQPQGKPICGYVIVIGVKCGSFSAAADSAEKAAINAYGTKRESLIVQEIEITRIDEDQWDQVVRTEINPAAFRTGGVYYVSNLILLDQLKEKDS